MNVRPIIKSLNGPLSLLIIILLIATSVSCSNPQLPLPAPASTPAPVPSVNPSPSEIPTATIPATQVSAPVPAPVSPSPTPAMTPTVSPTPSPSPTPTLYTPAAAPFKPAGELTNLFQYMLDLINKDRQGAGLNPVTLSYNAAAQKHAQNMLEKLYGAHWDTDGLKPYMRFTLEGGLNYEGENVAFTTGNTAIDAKGVLESFEHEMMFNDAASNWSHKQNILNKWHKRVNLGIAYDKNTVALDQQFEGDYVEFYSPPTIAGNNLTLSFRITQPNIALDNVSIAFDDLPQPITAEQLNTGPYHSYGLGQRLGFILPPPPPGQVYSNLPGNASIASRWEAGPSGQFSIQADIGPFLDKGKGVYTVVLVAKAGSESLNLTNYSIFIK